MKQIKTTTRNQSWSQHLRSRVGDVVSYLDTAWINKTGKNTEPGTSNDWLIVDDSSSDVTFNAWKQSILATALPISLPDGVKVLFVTVNAVPTFNFTQIGTGLTVDDVIIDDKLDFFGIINT